MDKICCVISGGDINRALLQENKTKYDCFIAECYEAEDEFWKGIYEEIETDYWINENKNNF